MTWRPSKKQDRAPAGFLCGVGNWAHRRIFVLILAFFFASFMAAAGSVGAIKAAGAAVTPHHDGAVAGANEHHQHGPCTTTEADPGCAEGHGQGGHGHGDASSTCCGFACHVVMAADERALISPLGHSNDIVWMPDRIQIIPPDTFERPPRVDAVQPG